MFWTVLSYTEIPWTTDSGKKKNNGIKTIN